LGLPIATAVGGLSILLRKIAMKNLEALRETFPDVARDIKINLSNVLAPGTLSKDQCFGIAIACAWTARSKKLALALQADAEDAGVEAGVLSQVSSTKIDFELMCLAVSTINNCVACIKAHEKVVLDGGLSHDHVHDSVRIAANVQAAALALSMVEA
jgi:lipoyl-dependent peroxiredoxin subunit D